VLEEGERREDREREEVPEDAEDDAIDPDVERLLGDDVVPGIDELHAHHGRVRPPPLAVPLPRRHPPPIPISLRLGWAVGRSPLPFTFFLVCRCAWLLLGCSFSLVQWAKNISERISKKKNISERAVDFLNFRADACPLGCATVWAYAFSHGQGSGHLMNFFFVRKLAEFLRLLQRIFV
jgi:hypothetical protein